MNILKELIYRLRGECTTEKLIKMGMTVGRNFKRLNNVLIDDSHAWLITIGDNVTLAPRVHILAHAASTKNLIGYTKIGTVSIGNNVFIGAESVILPGVSIGNDVIIGTNSTVTHDIPDKSVAVGSPAKIICSLDDYIAKEKANMKNSPVYGEEYTLNNITDEKKRQQQEELKNQRGYIV